MPSEYTGTQNTPSHSQWKGCVGAWSANSIIIVLFLACMVWIQYIHDLTAKGKRYVLDLDGENDKIRVAITEQEIGNSRIATNSVKLLTKCDRPTNSSDLIDNR
ncbi:hypothetical protein EDD15DRAFT_2195567 [Pisolithus albus]|nr:hypothetical protein EDD15DRAFT_2195567 [Pisolithus albus]